MNKTRKIKFNKKILFVLILIIVVLCGIFYTRNYDNDKFLMGTIDNELLVNTIDTKWLMPITVEITGEVVKPGIYKLMSGDLLAKTIELSGGLTQYADISSLNLSDMVFDNEKIYVPKRGENISSCISYSEALMDKKISVENETKKSLVLGDLIDINKANASELRLLPEIGPKTAESIIEYRNTHGKFNAIDEITNVSGIGNKTFEKIKDKITVE